MYYKVVKKKLLLQVVIILAHILALPIVANHVLEDVEVAAEVPAWDLARIILRVLVEETALGHVKLDAETLAPPLVKPHVQEHVVLSAEMIAGGHAKLVVTMDVLRQICIRQPMFISNIQ